MQTASWLRKRHAPLLQPFNVVLLHSIVSKNQTIIHMISFYEILQVTLNIDLTLYSLMFALHTRNCVFGEKDPLQLLLKFDDVRTQFLFHLLVIHTYEDTRTRNVTAHTISSFFFITFFTSCLSHTILVIMERTLLTWFMSS